MLTHLKSLFAHMRWADERTLAGLRTLPSPDATALRWFAHVLGSEHTWISRIEGVAPRVAVWPELDAAGCEALAAENHSRYDALLDTLDEAALDRVIRYTNAAGLTFDSRVGDILMHAAMHGQYHRGQVAAAVRACGGTPQATDYIAFSRGAPVGPRDPDA